MYVLKLCIHILKLCMHICMHICMHDFNTYIHRHAYHFSPGGGGELVCMHTHAYMHAYVCIYACICMDRYAYVCIRVHICMHMHAYEFPNKNFNCLQIWGSAELSAGLGVFLKICSCQLFLKKNFSHFLLLFFSIFFQKLSKSKGQ